jgi:hypothetical protein
MAWNFAQYINAAMDTFVDLKKQRQQENEFNRKMVFETNQANLANDYKNKVFDWEQKYQGGILERNKANDILGYNASMAKTKADADAKLRDDMRIAEQNKITNSLNERKFGLDVQKFNLDKMDKLGKLASAKQESIGGAKIDQEIGELGNLFTVYRKFDKGEKEIEVPLADGKTQTIDKNAWRAKTNKELYSLLTKTGIDPEGKEITDLWKLATGNIPQESFDAKTPEEKKKALKFALETYTKQVNLTLPQKTALQFYIEGVTK